MQIDLLNTSIDQVRKRASEGDCPTTPAFSVEWLEEMVLALALPLPVQEPVASTHEERIALAKALSWDITEITPDDVKGILVRLAESGFRLSRLVQEREPVGYVTKNELTKLRLGVSCVDLFGKVVPAGFEMVPLYLSPSPSIPEEKGGTAERMEIDRLRRMVERRDEFIIANGLWDAFKEACREN